MKTIYRLRLHVLSTLLLIGVGLLVPGESVFAAVFGQYTPSRHDRFLADGSDNPNFIAAGFDLSGIGVGNPSNGPNNEDKTRTSRVVLISPQHYIGANHASTGRPTFQGNDGNLHDYDIGSITRLNTVDQNGVSQQSDLRLYTLAAPIPIEHGVTPLAIADGDPNSLIGKDFFFFGNPRVNMDGSLTHMAGRNRVRDVGVIGFGQNQTSPTTVIYYTFDKAGKPTPDGVTSDSLGDDEAGLIPGDSGNGAFIEIGGQLALIGPHFGNAVPPGNSTANGDFFHNFTSLLIPYLDQIEDVVEGDGQTITRLNLTAAAVPEPSSVLLLLAGSSITLLRRRR